MRKGLIGIFLLIQIIGLSNLGYCKWSLINKTPAIEGRVADATTGEPIENVVISCEWVQEVPAFVDTVSKGFAHEVVITDKEGRYRIPSKTSVHFPPLLFVGSQFDEISIIISHPLYSRPMWIGAKKDYLIIGSEKRRIYKSEDGIIHWDIQLLSLEEKYSKAIETLKFKADSEERKRELEAIAYELGLSFIKFAQSGIVNFRVDQEYLYDATSIFSKWEEITNKIGKTRDLERAKEWILKERREYEK